MCCSGNLFWLFFYLKIHRLKIFFCFKISLNFIYLCLVSLCRRVVVANVINYFSTFRELITLFFEILDITGDKKID